MVRESEHRATPWRWTRPCRWRRTGAALAAALAGCAIPAGAAAAAGASDRPAPAALAASAGASNGITHLSARRALAKSLAALRAAPDLALSGTITEGIVKVRLSTESAAHGARAKGTLTAANAHAGFAGTLRFIGVGATDYLKGGPTFWRTALAKQAGTTAAERAALATRLAAAWVRLTGASAKAFTSGLGVLTKPAELAMDLTVGHGTLTKGKPKRIGTELALPITSSKGGTVWLATTGRPLPLEVTSPKRSATSGSVRLHYPKQVTIAAPKRSKTLAQLGV